ncbi:NAD binding domain of 6-phosphogluconate dehydrogenase-domain-containing protein [Morchella snyderi]|nr:NAD binding domain of 6-phosphogluconate dehydrogenase-domain-containing protein [Morchella snyderi]
MAPQLAWIGLGNMGRGMVKNIVSKANLDKPLIIYNRTGKRSQDFKASLEDPDSVQVVESIEEAVKAADIIFTSLGDDKSVNSVLDTALQVSGGVTGKLFVDTSTILPETSDAVAQKMRSGGAEFVAAPIFGAPLMADLGKLIVVLAGTSAAVDRILPYCEGVTARVTIDLRDQSPGKATLLKITGNTVILSMVETVAEGHVFAEKSGLGSEALHKFFEAMFPGPYAAYSTRMMTGDYMRDEPLFAVDLARKDVGHGINLAAKVGVDMQVLKVLDGHLKDLKEETGPKADLPAIYGIIRKQSGLPYSNQ